MSPSAGPPHFSSNRLVFERQPSNLPKAFCSLANCTILHVSSLMYEMPDMNGLELQSELAAAGYGIPIIFITAYDDKESRGRAMQAGAVAFLGKPFSDEQLLQTVRSALGHDKAIRNPCDYGYIKWTHQ